MQGYAGRDVSLQDQAGEKIQSASLRKGGGEIIVLGKNQKGRILFQIY